MKRPLSLLLLLTVVAMLAACSDKAPPAGTNPSPTTTGQEIDVDALKQAVREALEENDRLSGFVLWMNRVPAWATKSTRGPALAAMRKAAADRRERGIRIKSLESTLEISSIRLDASYASAVAIARSRQRVRPYEDGQPLGRAIKLDERARIHLHRLDDSQRFVVWEVETIP